MSRWAGRLVVALLVVAFGYLLAWADPFPCLFLCSTGLSVR